MKLQYTDTISTWLQDPLLETQGFLHIRVRDREGSSNVKLFHMPTSRLQSPPGKSMAMDETMQLIRKIESYLFVEQEHKTTRITHSDLVEAFSQQGQLKESSITVDVIANKPVQLRYMPDLDYTKEKATLLRLPWPPILSRLKDNLLARHSEIPGITTPYIYISPSARGSIFGLHIEDFNLYSLNLHHAGQTKHWIMIPRSQKPALFRLLAPLRLQLFGAGFSDALCDQWVRHLSVFVPTAILTAAGIEFTRVEQRPGDLIITGPETFHQGWNAGANMAEAINFASPTSQDFAHGYRSCTDTCKPALKGEDQLPLDHFAYYNLAANADEPIIIDFQSMQERSLPDTHATFRARGLLPPSRNQAEVMMAFGQFGFHCFPLDIIRDFYERYMPRVELPVGARDLKVKFVNDIARVFRGVDEFAVAYPQWTRPQEQHGPFGRRPRGLLQNNNFADLLARDMQAQWPQVPMQQRGPQAVTIAGPEDLKALDPCNRAASLYMTALDAKHSKLPSFLPMNTTHSKPFRYEYCGQGPPLGIWQAAHNAEVPGGCVRAMSCALDACIVAAMFLNLGRLKADAATPVPALFPSNYEYQSLLLPLIGTDWRLLQQGEAVRAKDQLYQLILKRRWEEMSSARTCPEDSASIFLPVSGPQGIWMRCTAGLGQFTFRGETIRRCTRCEHSQLANLMEPNFTASGVYLSDFEGCSDMAELVQRFFDGQPLKVRNCVACSSLLPLQMRRILATEPPVHMAVTPNGFFKQGGGPAKLVAEAFPLTYFVQGQTAACVAMYRWIGGIYLSGAHYRVYWESDSSTGGREVCLYDSDYLLPDGQIKGLIFGGVPAASPISRVPSPWQEGADVLFYERVG